MTKAFKIETGAIESTYEANTKEAAILAYVQDAGYSSIEAAADACGQSVEEFLADIAATEVEQSPAAGDFGAVEFGGQTIKLTEQAYPANNPLDVYPTYEAHGVSPNGAHVLVRWEVKEEFIGWDAETERFYWIQDLDSAEEDLCDWDKPAHVKHVEG